MYTQELKNLTEALIQEKEYLRSLSKRYEKDSEIFTEVIDSSNQVVVSLNERLNYTEARIVGIEGNYSARIDSLKYQVDLLKEENYKTKAKIVLYVVIAVILTAYLTVAIYTILKGKRLYFILRWIRDRIPLKI